ncbi:tellurite resistance TerB family protein [Methylobacterium nonmethylotrophicum]|uniref:Tellurite resistance TerB family protein n=1 Tax=Methylobacterium nonmethylotrophicum TaxID=1141884 RepID=A0A4Z0NF48_9HYPH|nr:tellurite resistance TerB family protein [Methylobacterium nonmethylotrophicum]TGD94794.1 tellurite resistance TerB family protein [Methylobacterium nonmethylotrophicum]
MFDAKRLLDQFLGGPPRGGSYGQPPGQMPYGQAPYGHAPSPLEQVARSLGSGGGKAAVLGGLASLVLGGRRGQGGFGSSGYGSGLGAGGRIGGLALVASLAYQAYQNWQANQGHAQGRGAAPARAGGFIPSAEEAAAMLGGSRFAPASAAEEQDRARALLIAMITAAKADGHIDADEQRRIFGEMDRHALDADDKAFLMDALRAPVDVEAVARLARNPEQASEIYAASLMAISVDTPQERAYLDHLARRLGLDPGLSRHIEATLAAAASQR